jgi:hypothetical protein
MLMAGFLCRDGVSALVDAMVLPGCRMSSSLTKNETI